MKKILILGKDGMLGSQVLKYFKLTPDISVTGISFRFIEKPIEYRDMLERYFISYDFVINCIGAIPQKTNDYSINYSLPEALVSLCRDTNTEIIHPSTDCEFKGTLPVGELYSVTDYPDSTTEYGLSKILGSNIILESGIGKVIRTSIIGLSPNSYRGKGLLNWFRGQEGNVFGYTNHHWNGVTTLEWAIAIHHLIENYDKYPDLIQLGSKPLTKAGLLSIFRRVYERKNPITLIEADEYSNKCLKSNFDYPNKKLSIEDQLMDFKLFNSCI